ncbi:hypothetical protein PFISCL1PPCAC_5770, partial [Pristionchus fissidentatus]
FQPSRAMNDSVVEDLYSMMQSFMSEQLCSSVFEDDRKLTVKTRSVFKQAARDEKKIRSSSEQERRALESDIAHSKARLSELKADCERVKIELSTIEEENVKLEKEEIERKAFMEELRRDLVRTKLEKLKILKTNSEQNLINATAESRRLALKIDARSAGVFPISDSQNLVFVNGVPRIQTISTQ